MDITSDFKDLCLEVKKNREFLISWLIKRYGFDEVKNYYNVKLYYISGEKDMFINNSTKRNNLRKEEIEILKKAFSENKFSLVVE